MIGIIYIHTNRINGKCYVGQTTNLRKRWKPESYWKCCLFNNALKRYGWDGFDHQIVIQKEMTRDELNNYEMLWIAALNSADNRYGYNLTAGGVGGDVGPEGRRKMSEALKGRKIPDEVRDKISSAHKKIMSSAANRKQRSDALKRAYASGLRSPIRGPRGKKQKPRTAEHSRQISERMKLWWATRKQPVI